VSDPYEMLREYLSTATRCHCGRLATQRLGLRYSGDDPLPSLAACDEHALPSALGGVSGITGALVAWQQWPGSGRHVRAQVALDAQPVVRWGSGSRAESYRATVLVWLLQVYRAGDRWHWAIGALAGPLQQGGSADSLDDAKAAAIAALRARGVWAREEP